MSVLTASQMQEAGAVLRVAGMPVGVPAQLAAATACNAAGGGAACQQWITLAIAAGAAWYGYRRHDAIGWAILISAAASVIYSAAFWESLPTTGTVGPTAANPTIPAGETVSQGPQEVNI